MIFTLAIFLFIILIFNYRIFNSEIVNPAILFIIGFFICSVIACIFRHELGLETFSLKTFTIIIIGILTYTNASYFIYKDKVLIINYKRDYFIPHKISSNRLVILLLFQIFTYIAIGIIRTQQTGFDLITASGYINEQQKFGNETFPIPRPFSYFYGISLASCYVIAVLIGYNIVIKKRDNILLLILNFIASILGGLLTGGRSAILQQILALTVISVLFIYIKNRKSIKIRKYIIIGCFLGFIFFMFFDSLGESIGRNTYNNTVPSYVVYCGAELKNLDIAVTTEHKKDKLFGENTFRSFYWWLSGYINNKDFINAGKNKDFQLYRNTDLGNVYTTFYPYLRDFGWLGLIVLTAIFAITLQLIYIKTLSRTKMYLCGNFNIWILLYAAYCYVPFQSYFHDKFYDLFNLSLVYNVLYLYIVNIFVTKKTSI